MSAASFKEKLGRIDWPLLASIDLRSLALFRIGLGIMMLVSLSTFWGEVGLFLTDYGVFPRRMAIEGPGSRSISLMMAGGGLGFAVTMLSLTALCAVALILGYYTRVTTVLCWLLMSSLHLRAYLTMSGADGQLLIMLFWGMFLPLGGYFSVDNALARTPTTQRALCTVATLALLLQLTYIYLVGALQKTGDAWLVDYTAVSYAVSALHLATSFSSYLADMPQLARWFTLYVYHLELYAVIFLFLPVFTAQARLLMFVLLGSMHLGFYMFLSVSFFPWVSLTGLTVFIPGFFWDRLGRYLTTWPTLVGIRIYYDEPCDFCKKTCLIFRELSVARAATVLPAQSDSAIYEIMQRENSWVVQTHDGRQLVHWDAVSYLWRRSPILWLLGVLFLLPGMRGLGNALYRQIATHRGKLAGLSERLLPYHESVNLTPGPLNAIIVTPCIVAVLWGNLHSLKRFEDMYFPRPVAELLMVTQLWQEWRMFAPHPAIGSAWPIIEGQLGDGRTVDLLYDRMEPPDHDKIPTVSSQTYPSRRWHKYLENIDWQNNGMFYAMGKCTQWQGSNPQNRLESLKVSMNRQETKLGSPRKDWSVLKNWVFTFRCPPPPRPGEQLGRERGRPPVRGGMATRGPRPPAPAGQQEAPPQGRMPPPPWDQAPPESGWSQSPWEQAPPPPPWEQSPPPEPPQH